MVALLNYFGGVIEGEPSGPELLIKDRRRCDKRTPLIAIQAYNKSALVQSNFRRFKISSFGTNVCLSTFFNQIS